MTRVFGFEILPAPSWWPTCSWASAAEPGRAPGRRHQKERVGVYLTNALTGWEPPQGPKQQLIFPELEEERDAAEEVKRDKPILVILGNPPYNAFAGVSAAGGKGPGGAVQGGLDFPVGHQEVQPGRPLRPLLPPGRAPHRRDDRQGRGLLHLQFLLPGRSLFVVMRQRFLSEFDTLWFDCLNGDSRETGKLTPDGKPDPSVFSTEYNREGIRVGTAIGLMVRQEQRRRTTPTVRFRHFGG